MRHGKHAEYFFLLPLLLGLSGIALLVFAMYIFFPLLLEVPYEVPLFIHNIIANLITYGSFSESGAVVFVIFMLMLSAIVSLYVAFTLSRMLEREMLGEYSEKEALVVDNQNTKIPILTEVDRVAEPVPHFAWYMILLCCGVVFVVFSLHWLISL